MTGDFYKVLSWAINDYQFVSKLFFESGTDIYLSTGMSNYAELDLLVREYRQYEKKMFLIHTQLSFNIDDVCLAVIPEMKNRYGPIVCYGHHCEDMSVLDLSTAFLPNSIFFYVKLNDRIIYPDDKHAVNLEQIDLVVSRLNMLPRAIGVPEKVQMKNQVEGVK